MDRRNKRVENIIYKRNLKEKVKNNQRWGYVHQYNLRDDGALESYSIGGAKRTKHLKRTASRKFRRNNIDYLGKTNVWKKEFNLAWEIG